MGGVLSLLAPYEQSFAYDDLERDIQAIFVKAFNELYGDRITDIHHYGMPQLGSPAVVERFTKQDGLAVLRRPSSSDEIMRVIYANWKSLSSKRGLAFLEFVLQMLWADQWEVRRLYHSIGMIDLYPTVATFEPIEDSFLTSRITISMDHDVDFSEVRELAPTLIRLVPANIVAQISAEMPLDDFDRIGIGMVMMPQMTAHLYKYDPITESTAPPWSEWIILRKLDISPTGAVTYKAFKSNMWKMYESVTSREIAPHMVNLLSNEDYQKHQGALDAIAVLTAGHIGYKWDVPNARIVSNKLPDPVSYIEASRALLARFDDYSLGDGNGFFQGYKAFYQAVERVGWVVFERQVCEIVDSSVNAFKSGEFYSTVSFRDSFDLNMAYQIKNNPDLVDAVIGEVEIKTETETKVEYIQHYTKPEVQPEEPPTDPEEPPTDPEEPPADTGESSEGTEEPTTDPEEPPTDPEVPPTDPEEPAPPVIIQVPYELLVTVDVVPNPKYQPDYEGEFLPLALEARDVLLDDLKLFFDNYGDESVGEILLESLNEAYSYDPTGIANHLYNANLHYHSFTQIKDQLLSHANGNLGEDFEKTAEAYILKIANTVFEADPANQIIKRSDLNNSFSQNQTAV